MRKVVLSRGPSRTRRFTSMRRCALVVMGILLSGCFTWGDGTAMDWKRPADRVAAKWDEHAFLTKAACVEGAYSRWMDPAMGFFQVGALEPTLQDPSAQGSLWKRAADDPRVGDGRCEVWVYQYASPIQEHESRLLAFSRSGRIIFEMTQHDRTGDMDFRSLPRVQGWAVDSDRAVSAARNQEPRLEEALKQEGAGLLIILEGQADATARWVIHGGHTGGSSEDRPRVVVPAG